MQSLEELSFRAASRQRRAGLRRLPRENALPGRLAALYPLPKGPPPYWEVIAAVAVLVAISAAAFAAGRRCPYLLFGWLWYLGTLVPVIGLVQVGDQAMADRYTYLTQIGLYMAFAWGAPHWPALGPIVVGALRPLRRWCWRG